MTDSAALESRLAQFENYLTQDPENPKLLGDVAEVYLQLGRFDQARLHIEKALNLASEDAGLRFKKASIALAAGPAEEAIQILHNLQAEGHDHPVLRYNLAYALLLLRRLGEAKELLDTIVDNAETPDAPLLLARVQHHLGDLKKAKQYAKQFIAKHSDHAEALGVLALIELDDGKDTRARLLAEQATALNPDNLESLVTLGTVALDGLEGEEALQHFSQATKVQPQSGRAWSGMGLTHMLGRDLDTAVSDLERAVKYMPSHLGTWHALAWCKLVKDDIAGAKAAFESAMQQDRNFSENHGGLAVIAVVEGDLAEAEAAYKRALKLDPMCFSGLFAKSLVLNQKGKSEAAQSLIKKIITAPLDESGESVQAALQRMMRKQ